MEPLTICELQYKHVDSRCVYYTEDTFENCVLISSAFEENMQWWIYEIVPDVGLKFVLSYEDSSIKD